MHIVQFCCEYIDDGSLVTDSDITYIHQPDRLVD